MTRNHAGLVASTPQTWQGLSGDSFRVAMTTIAGATYGLSAAYSYAGDLVTTLSTVTKLACAGIGQLLKMIADKLLEMAAEAAAPVIGWAIGAFNSVYSYVQDIIKWVRRVNTLIETHLVGHPGLRGGQDLGPDQGPDHRGPRPGRGDPRGSMSTREEQLLSQVEGILAETRRDAERVTRDDAERDERRAAAARGGQLGPDGRAGQRRIHAGKNSPAEVFGGVTSSPPPYGCATVARHHRGQELPDELTEEIAALWGDPP